MIKDKWNNIYGLLPILVKIKINLYRLLSPLSQPQAVMKLRLVFTCTFIPDFSESINLLIISNVPFGLFLRNLSRKKKRENLQKRKALSFLFPLRVAKNF